MATERQEDLRYLAQLIDAGAVTPVIDRSYPLGDAPGAIRHMHDGHARGKVVITV
jgi:NADPH:quinone reductase-like Zn-dependent oxidoreductase